MAQSSRDLERLAAELAALTPDERARVLADVARRATLKPPPPDFSPPLLTGGDAWTGGSMRREELYGDDGR